MKCLSLSIYFLPLALAACSTQQSITHCPLVKNWDANQQKEMANELGTLTPGNLLVEVMQDYMRMRAEAKLCYAYTY